MTYETLIQKVRYHWHCYVAHGGFDEPSCDVGELSKVGQLHWFYFLLYGRRFVLDYPEKTDILLTVFPKATLGILTGK